MKNVYLTTTQAAKLCNVTRFTIRNWVNSGKLKSNLTAGGHRRILQEDLVKFAQEHNITRMDKKTADALILNLRGKRIAKRMKGVRVPGRVKDIAKIGISLFLGFLAARVVLGTDIVLEDTLLLPIAAGISVSCAVLILLDRKWLGRKNGRQLLSKDDVALAGKGVWKFLKFSDEEVVPKNRVKENDMDIRATRKHRINRLKDGRYKIIFHSEQKDKKIGVVITEDTARLLADNIKNKTQADKIEEYA